MYYVFHVRNNKKKGIFFLLCRKLHKPLFRRVGTYTYHFYIRVGIYTSRL